MSPSYTFMAELWMYHGEGAWYFITLPEEYADEIKAFTHGYKGFGSRKVIATIRDVTWSTSIFPDKRNNSYLLPVKKEVRSRLNADNGDELKVLIELSDV